MACVLRLMSTTAGVPTEFDGMYVVAYDPTVRCEDGSYDGGLLEVTTDPAKAMRFPDAGAALAKWKEKYGWREDGEWRRPLTAWNVSIESAPEESHGTSN